MSLGQEGPQLDMGACQLTLDAGNPGEIIIEPTYGGVLLKDTLGFTDIFEDGYGESPVDSVTKGRIVTIEANFTRETFLILAALIKGSTAGAANLVVGNSVGEAVYDDAVELLIKPMENNSPLADTSKWLHVFKTSIFNDFEKAFDATTQRVTKVLIKAYPHDTSPYIGKYYRMGAA